MDGRSQEDRGCCHIAEIIQYTCDVKKVKSSSEIHCFPIPRIFRLCPGKPAVEVTKLVNVDARTGETNIPPSLSSSDVRGKDWKKVTRYEV